MQAESANRGRIIIRADAGGNVGFGHLVRSCALASYLRDVADCHIASYSHAKAPDSFPLRTEIINSGAEPLVIAASDKEEFDKLFLSELKPDDVVVLDNYYFDTHYQHQVKKRCKALVCIDDMHDRHFCADAVISFSPHSRADYSLESYTKLYTGLPYSLLREPFFQKRGHKLTHCSAQNIILAIGGADPLQLTDKFVKLILENFPDSHLTVISGNPKREWDQLNRVNVYSNLGAAEVCELLDNADLGIFPASTICVEAFSRELPVIAGYFVDNQLDFYHYSADHKLILPIGDMRDSIDVLTTKLNLIKSGLTKFETPEIDFCKGRAELQELFETLIQR